MIRNIKFIILLIKLKLSRMIVFRFSFFGAFFADATLFLIQLLTFNVIYGHIDSIGGFNRGQMIIFVGTFSLINALNMSIYFFGIVDIPGMIKRGDLDHYLTKPINPLLRLTFENVNPGSFLLIVLSVFIVKYGVSIAGVNESFYNIVGYIILVLLMTLLWYDMELILRSITFFVMSSNGIGQLGDQMLELNFKVPGVLYRGFMKILFYLILPYGIMSTIPTQFITGSISATGVLVSVATVAIFTSFALWFWKLGLKNYKSASS